VRQQPQQRGTLMQPLQCVLQHHVANPQVSTRMATEHGNNHAAISLRSTTTDSKTPFKYAHMNNRMQQNREEEQIRVRNGPSRNRLTHEVLQPLYPK